MAKTTGGLLSLGSSGSIADTLTYASWRGIPYVRQRVVPANPQSTEQSLTRNSFKNAEQIWKVAGPLFRAPWDRLAVGQSFLGRNAFIGRYVADLRTAANLQLMTFSPGAKGGLPPTSVSAAAVIGGTDVTIVAPALPTGWTIQAAVAAAIIDGDPQTITVFNTTEGEDLTSPYVVQLTGLTTVLHVVGGWLRWVKPDGSIAYGASLNDTVTPT